MRVGNGFVGPQPDQVGGHRRARIGQVGDRGLRHFGDAAVIGLGGRRPFRLPAAEAGADQFLHHRRIGVADHDDGGALGPVPAPVEGLQPLGAGGVKRLVGADRVALGEEQSGVEEWLREIVHAAAELGAPLLLGQHHGPLGRDRRRLEARPRHHLGEHGEAGVERLTRRMRKVQHIDGVGGVGPRIAVAAEARAQLLPDLPRPPVRIALRTLEQHMLDEMRPAALLVALVQRACVDPDADRDLPRRQAHCAAPHSEARWARSRTARPDRGRCRSRDRASRHRRSGRCRGGRRAGRKRGMRRGTGSSAVFWVRGLRMSSDPEASPP